MSYITDALYNLNLLENSSSRSTIKSNLRILLIHMLKCKYPPEYYSNKGSWVTSIVNSYSGVTDEFIDIGKGSLYKTFYIKQLNLEHIYKQAKLLAAKETGKPLNVFPDTCPWTKEQLVNLDFITDFIDTYGQDNQ